MLKQQQPAPSSRKPAVMAVPGNGSPGSPNGSLPSAGSRGQERGGAGRGRSIVKGLQPPVFEGVYNNSRMLHFLTAVVGSTCDVKVKNGGVYQGIFKTLSSKFELAVDAVHKKTNDQVVGPKREDIVDTMIFKHSDVTLVHFRNVDFNYATKDKFTDSAIATSSKVNGEHKEKVLMRWDGGENTDDYDLDSDMSNGWDPNDMFKFNEDNYGVKTTYDSSLSSYTVPLEKDNTDEYRQREARATQLAREIESSPQYRQRIAIENDDCKTEEEKHSAVIRPNSDRDSPSLGSRDGKYVPLPQRVREGTRGGMRSGSTRGGRPGMGSITPRGPSQHYPDTSSSPVSEQRGINGGPSRMSPKTQRPIRSSKPMSSPSSRPGEVSTSPSAASRVYSPLSPKSTSSVASLENAVAASSPASTPDSRPPAEPSVSAKPPSPKSVTPTLPGEGKEMPPVASKESSRATEPTAPSDTVKPCKVLQTEQKRIQLDELRKFGAEFRLQESAGPDSAADGFPGRQRDALDSKVTPADLATCEVAEPLNMVQKVAEPAGDAKDERVCESSERQDEAPSPSSKTLPESKEEPAVCEYVRHGRESAGQVKKSTLNPNAKEFNPSKPLLAVNKATSTPTSPGPRNHSSATTIPMLAAGQSGVYSPYISYIPQLHAPQMYSYPVSGSVPGQQGKYRPKGSLPPQRSDQQNSAPPMMQAAAAAGPPLVAATPYSPYIYSPQQFPGQPTMMQTMAHYPSQPVFAQMLQGNPRMITSGNHQALVSSSNSQYPPTDQPAPQTLYATVHQPYSHHAAQLHPQPASTPTQNQQQSQHANPSPVQHQGGQPPHLASGQPQQSLYHTATLTATPPSMTPGPTAQSPQSTYPQQAVYAIHAHQQLQHGYANMSHVAQAHVQSGITGAPPPPHPGGPHPSHPGGPHPTQVMLLHPSQTHGGPPQAGVQQTGVSNPSPYTYIQHHQVQSHPSQQLPYHPPGN
ncbi:ataxin-2-like protein isoform X2 [Spea bombifrons]|uniref:ataxin-2-like protein isoform X2 n=1 Tax=Spea bombifrons TaxID=233779 RepID=UPI0023496332|nr:ataxin-2-like protein isoform X2 [Spea bombifrons]